MSLGTIISRSCGCPGGWCQGISYHPTHRGGNRINSSKCSLQMMKLFVMNSFKIYLFQSLLWCRCFHVEEKWLNRLHEDQLLVLGFHLWPYSHDLRSCYQIFKFTNYKYTVCMRAHTEYNINYFKVGKSISLLLLSASPVTGFVFWWKIRC